MKPIPKWQNYFTEHTYGKGDRTVFIFGGWKFGALAYRFLVSSLVKRGYRCILYVPSKRLIAVGAPYSEIVTASTLVLGRVSSKIELEKAQGTKMFVSFGISFGTIFAMECAKKCAGIRKLVLIAPFGDFAEHVKLWPGHRYFSKVLASQPTSQRESGEVLNRVGLTIGLSNLTNTRVLISYANNDKIVHTEVTAGLIDALHASKIRTEVRTVSGGHLWGIGKSLAIQKVYSHFLAS